MGLLDSIKSGMGGLFAPDNVREAMLLTIASGGDPDRAAKIRRQMAAKEDQARLKKLYDLQLAEAEAAQKARQQGAQKEEISRAILQSVAMQGGPQAFQTPEIQGLLRPYAAAQADPKMLEAGGLLAPPEQMSRPTSAMTNLQAAGFKPGTQEFEAAMRAYLEKPRSSVTVNSGPSTPDLPKGYMWKDPTNIAAGVVPIPGGPSDTAEARAAANAARLAKVRSTVEEVDKALADVSNWTAGPGSVTRVFPGAPAVDLKGALTTIKANVGFDELQAMRQASPTGGALGQVAVQELEALQASVASLDQEQSPERLAENLEKVKRHYSRWFETTQGRDPNMSYPVPPSGAKRLRYNSATGEFEE